MRRGWNLPNFVSAPADAGVDCQEDDAVPQTSRDERSPYRGLGERLEPFVFLEDTDSPADKERILQQATINFYRALLQQESRGSKLDLPVSDFCRICRDTDSHECYISPCYCKGTLAMVHRSCLERWLAESDTSFCELCGFQYRTIRIPRYGMMQSIALWVTQAAHRDLLFDAIAFGAFTPLALLGTYMGLSAGRSYYHMSGETPSRTNSMASQLVALGVIGFMAAIDFSCTAWLVMRLQHHATHWYSWWRRNCVVRLHLTAEQEKNILPAEAPEKSI